jgi:hypothetical protein
MADPNKYKSVSVPIKVYNMLIFLGEGKLVHNKDLKLTVSKTIELLTKRMAKRKGYKNGNGK